MTGIDARFWLDLAQWVTTVAIGVYVYMANHNRATRAQIKSVDDKHEEAIKVLSNRVIEAEGAIKHFPTNDQFAQLRTAQAETQGTVKAVDEKVEGIRGMMKSMETRLFMLTENELAEARDNKKGGNEFRGYPGKACPADHPAIAGGGRRRLLGQ